MQNALALLAFAVASLMLAVATVDLASPRLRIWPPETKGNRIEIWFIWVFRLMFYALLGATVLLLWDPANRPSGIRMALGAALAVLGFATAVYATLWMGWRTAFGDTGPLARTGPFRYSRHPVYVSTWAGQLGWALLVNDPLLHVTLAIWAALYVIAIRLEEPWMLARFGADYAAYQRSTPQLIGRPRRT